MKPWEAWYFDGEPNAPRGPVLQEWVVRLPLRFQGSLITAVRGCDLAPKFPAPADSTYVAENGRSVGAERELTAFLRYCVLNAADPREIGVPGAFFQPLPPPDWKPSQFGHYPQHWYAHIMHAFEIVGYEHPGTGRGIVVRDAAHEIYLRLVHNLHLPPESRERLWERLTEDRIVTNTVVS